MTARARWRRQAVLVTALAALTALLPILSGCGADTDRGGTAGSGAAAEGARQEQRLKAAAVERDADLTARLCTLECAREFRKLSADGQSASVAHMIKMHPHMTYVRLKQPGGKTVTGGAVPKTAASELDAMLAKAERQAAEGRQYEAIVKQDGHRYLVLAVPGTSGGTAAGIIRQDIVDEVQRHQRRNMRLVPYPAEGRYRTESVKPNSTEDITVKTGEDNGKASHYHTNEAVVRFPEDPTEAQLEQIMREIDGDSVRKLGYTHVFKSKSMRTEALIGYFQEKWKPVYAEPHYLYLTNAPRTRASAEGDAGGQAIVPNDLLYAEYQWNLPAIETERGWTLSKGTEEVIVAVLDTGVQLDHPDLAGKLTEGTNIVADDAPNDDVGHGTHVAGVIAAAVNNKEGVAGMSWYNRVMPVKVLDSSGTGTTYSVAEGIIWATDHGAKVINMSLGNYASAQFLHDAVQYAYDHDVVLIAASGNDNTDQPGYPAAYPEVFAVAATDARSEKASFSNYGDYIDAAAPGDGIPSTYPGNQYAALSGTSMASPHVAALAGLIRSVNPALSNEEVMDIMRSTAVDLGEHGPDIYFGHGLVDVARALEAAEQSAHSLGRFPQQLERRLAALKERFLGGGSQ